jgi:hypothetical protein
VNSATGIKGNHGFEFLLPNELFDAGNHTVAAVAVSGSRMAVIPGSGKTFTLPTRPRPVIGQLETISEEGVARGWALNPGDPGREVVVSFVHQLVSGVSRPVGRTVTRLPRPDVNADWKRHGNPGFEFRLEDLLLPGQYQVRAFAESPQRADVELGGGPLTLVRKTGPSFRLVPPPQGPRVVFHDARYACLWVSAPERIARYFVERDFSEVDADALRSWMQARIQSGAPGSVCVFAQDIGPETVAEEPTPECTLRKYLEAGGRVVWLGDVPFAYFATADGIRSPVRIRGGGSGILGVSDWKHLEGKAELTEEGKSWGLSSPDEAIRSYPDRDVTVALSRAAKGYAASWFKNYNPQHPHSGFVRLAAGQVNGADDGLLAQLHRAALHGLS